MRGYNLLLERIKAAFQRERRTAANIAHELKTPIAELQLHSEVALRFAEGETVDRAVLEEVRGIAEQMGRQVGTILELARFESGQIPLEPEELDLGELARECWQHLRVVADAESKSLRWTGDEAARVFLDRAALSIIFSNLLSNAVEYSPPGSEIHLAMNRNGGCSMTLENQASDLENDDLDKLTEPFWRASTAREDRSHAGIGLALARRLVDLLELRMNFAVDSGLFRVSLHFPDRQVIRS